MNNYRVITKRDYNHGQNNKLLLVKEYLIIEKNSKKYLLIRLQNKTFQNLKEFNFEVVQKDLNGNYIATSDYKQSDLKIKSHETFIPELTLELDDRCEDVYIELKTAIFDKTLFDDGKKYAISSIGGKEINKNENEVIRKKTNKLPRIAAIVSFLVLLAVSLVSVFSIMNYKKRTYTFTLDNFEYSFLNGNGKDDPIVINRYNGDEKNILIPLKVENHDILSIQDDAFRNNDSIESIYIEGEITIGDSAFEDCNSLKSAYIEKVTSIGANAFMNTELETLSLKNVDYIGANAFASSKNLRKINIESDKKVRLDSYSFADCPAIKDISIDCDVVTNEFVFSNNSNVENLKIKNLNDYGHGKQCLRNAFGNLSMIKTLEIGNVSKIEPRFLADCHHLESVKIDSVNSNTIGSYAFSNCPKLEEISLPNNIEHIGSHAFNNTSIKSFDASNVKTIDESAFLNCSKLNRITLTDSLEYLGQEAFKDCRSLNSIYLSSNLKTINNYTFNGCFKLAKVTFGNNSKLQSINDGAFNDNSKLISINLPESLNYFGIGVFKNCSSLTNIKIPNSISVIRSSTFDGCTSLTNTNSILHQGIETIEDNAFRGCLSLRNVKVPTSLTSIGKNAFSNCMDLLSLEFAEGSTLNTIGHQAFSNCSRLIKIDLPKSLLYINKNAFEDCTSLVSVKINGYIDSIGERAFTNCSNLKEFIINDGVNEFGEYILYGATSIEKLVLPYVGRNKIENQRLSYLFSPSEISAYVKNLYDIEIREQEYFNDNFFVGLNNLHTISLPKVTQISESMFADCTNLSKVLLNDTYSRIGASAFANCKSLTEFKIPDSVEYIGDYAFSECFGLNSFAIKKDISLGEYILNKCLNITNLVIPSMTSAEHIFGGSVYPHIKDLTLLNQTSVDQATFANLNDLEKVTINNLTDIYNYAFTEKLHLQEVNIKGTVNSLGEGAFYSCPELKIISMTSNITRIPDYAFYSCNSLINIGEILNEKITDIGSYAFYNCYGLKRIVIPNFVTGIGVQAFKGCKNARTINFGDNNVLETIDENAFDGCALVKNIVIPASVTNVYSQAFSHCDSLQSINLQNANIDMYVLMGSNNIEKLIIKAFNSSNALFNVSEYKKLKSVEILDQSDLTADCFNGYTSLSKIILNNTVTIGDNCFQGLANLNSISLNEGIDYIGSGAFKNCINLEDVVIPSTVTSISASTFENCKALTSLDNILVESITAIHDNAFKDCAGLYYVNIPSNVTSIGANSFTNCSAINEFTFAESSVLESIGSYAFSNCNLIENLILPDSVKTIGDNAFDYCTSLYELYISPNATFNSYSLLNKLPNLVILTIPSITSIQDLTSYSTNENLLELTISNQDNINHMSFGSYLPNVEKLNLLNTTSIGDSCFQYNSNLKEINLNEGVEYIGNSAFAYCSSLVKVNIPSTVTTIPSYAFSGCTSLTSLKNILIEGIATISNSAFNGCSGLTYVTIPNTVTAIESNAFSNCTALTDLTFALNSNLSSIGSHAFNNCGLTEINLPDSTVEIENYAFSNCNSVTKITSFASDITFSDRVFDGCNNVESLYLPKSNRTIYSLFGYQNPEVLKDITLTKQTEFSSTFENCTNVTKIDIPSAVKLSYRTFADCNSLTTLNLPDTLTTIENEVFYKCDSLEKIVVPDSVTELNNRAFYYCGGAKEIIIGEGVTYIHNETFLDCINLEKVVFPKSLQNCDSWSLFGRCCNLYLLINKSSLDLYSVRDEVLFVLNENDHLPEIIEQGNYKFAKKDDSYYMITSNKEARALETLELPELLIDGKQTEYKVKNDLFSSATDFKKVIIPNYITEICEDAFINNQNLTDVIFAEDSKLAKIGSEAFEYCDIKELKLPTSLQTIGSSAFRRNENLSVVTVGENLTFIDYDAFNDCKRLFEVFNFSPLDIELHSNNHGKIAYYALSIHNKSEESNVVPFTYDNFKFTLANGNVYMLGMIDNYNPDKLILPDKVVYNGTTYASYGIHVEAFYNKNFTEVTIPDAVTSIGDYAFRECYQLNKVNINKTSGIKSIGKFAFENCNKIQNITLPEGLETIGSEAFQYCHKLRNIILPSTLTSVGYDAFYNCYSLLEVINLSSLNAYNQCGSVTNYAKYVHTQMQEFNIKYFTDENYEYMTDKETCYIIKYFGSNRDLVLPDSVTIEGREYTDLKIGRQAFDSMYLDKLTISKNIIGFEPYAFQNSDIELIEFAKDSRLKTIGANSFSSINRIKYLLLPEGLETIEQNAFSDAYNLYSIKLPKSLKTIEYDAFSNCSRLFYIINLSDLKLELGSNENGNVARWAFEIETKDIKELPNIYGSDNWYNGYRYYYGIIEDRLYIYDLDVYYDYDDVRIVIPNNEVIYGYTINEVNITSRDNNFGSPINYVILPKEINKIDEFAFKDANITSVLYYGSKADWSKVDVRSKEILTSDIYFYETCSHNFDSWSSYNLYGPYMAPIIGLNDQNLTVLEIPTCEKEGLAQFTCSRCGKQIEVVMPRLNHEFDAEGYCSLCNKKRIDISSITEGLTMEAFSNYGSYITTDSLGDGGVAKITYAPKTPTLVEFEFILSSELEKDILTINDKEYSGNVKERIYTTASLENPLVITYRKDVKNSFGLDKVVLFDITIFEQDILG